MHIGSNPCEYSTGVHEGLATFLQGSYVDMRKLATAPPAGSPRPVSSMVRIPRKAHVLDLTRR